MRQWIDLFEASSQDEAFWQKYNLGGCWILPDGSVREVDHRAGIHHGEIALKDFREHISHNEDGEFDKYSSGEAINMAMQDGWVQVSIRTPDKGLTIGYHPPMSAQAKRTLVRFIRDQPEHMSYEIFTTDAPFVVMNSKNEIMSKMSRIALGEDLMETRGRDAAYDRFWWSEDDDFEDVNDTSHADHAMGYFSDIASGDYDDMINQIGNEDEANTAYMKSRGAVRGGYLASVGHAYLDAMNLKLIRKCLQAMAANGRHVLALSLECGRTTASLDGDDLEKFIRSGRLPRQLAEHASPNFGFFWHVETKQIVEIKTSHTAFVIDHPEVFGLSEDDVKSPGSRDFCFALLERVLDMGWVRCHGKPPHTFFVNADSLLNAQKCIKEFRGFSEYVVDIGFEYTPFSRRVEEKDIPAYLALRDT